MIELFKELVQNKIVNRDFTPKKSASVPLGLGCNTYRSMKYSPK